MHSTSAASALYAVHFREWCLSSTPIPEPVLKMQSTSCADAHYSLHFRNWCSRALHTELALTIHSTSGTGAHVHLSYGNWRSLSTLLPAPVSQCTPLPMFTVIHFQKNRLTLHYTSGTCAHYADVLYTSGISVPSGSAHNSCTMHSAETQRQLSSL